MSSATKLTFSEKLPPANILLVDDEARNLDVLDSLLDSPDYHLVRALTAERALMLLLDGDFAAIVLDIQMPGMSGIELATLIKQRRRTQHIPIILLIGVAADHVDDQLVVDTVERDVPEPVVQELREEQRRRIVLGVDQAGRAGDLCDGHASHPVSMIRGQGVGDDVAGVVSDQGEPLMAEFGHHCGEVVAEGGRVIAVRRSGGQPDAPLVDCDDGEILREGRHHESPRVPALGPAVHEQERRSVTADDHVLADSIGLDEPVLEDLGESGREIRGVSNRTFRAALRSKCSGRRTGNQ